MSRYYVLGLRRRISHPRQSEVGFCQTYELREQIKHRVVKTTKRFKPQIVCQAL